MNNFPIPRHIKRVLKQLNNKGYSAYLVGGCVRDTLLNRVPNDYDITTQATPEEVMALFPHSYAVGLKFGTVGVVEDGETVEVTTYRIEEDYTDFRHPDSVSFSRDIAHDLSRRDFTVNALAMSAEGELVDYYGGMADLEKGILRAVGNPDNRFYEDPLRMLRAIRFSATLDFQLEEKTKSAIVNNAHLCKHISAERICAELEKLIMSNSPEAFSLIISLGLAPHILPASWAEKLNQADITYIEKLLRLINKFEKSFPLRLGVLTALLNYITHTDCAQEFVASLKTSKENSSAVNVAQAFVRDFVPNRHDFARLIAEYGIDSVKITLQLRELVNEIHGSFANCKEVSEALERELLAGGLTLESLAVSGKDLFELGLRGRKIRDGLSLLHEIVLDDAAKNQRQLLLDIMANSIIDSVKD